MGFVTCVIAQYRAFGFVCKGTGKAISTAASLSGIPFIGSAGNLISGGCNIAAGNYVSAAFDIAGAVPIPFASTFGQTAGAAISMTTKGSVINGALKVGAKTVGNADHLYQGYKAAKVTVKAVGKLDQAHKVGTNTVKAVDGAKTAYEGAKSATGILDYTLNQM